jgi:hypothetical protein
LEDVVRLSRPASLIAAGAVVALAASPAHAVPPPGAGNCVSAFVTSLPPTARGKTISAGAQALQPFGRNIVSQQARAPLGDCIQP